VINWGDYSVDNTVYDVVRTEPLSPLTLVLEGPLTDDSQVHVLWDAVSDPETGLD
jgi:hypothetical protein